MSLFDVQNNFVENRIFDCDVPKCGLKTTVLVYVDSDLVYITTSRLGPGLSLVWSLTEVCQSVPDLGVLTLKFTG